MKNIPTGLFIIGGIIILLAGIMVGKLVFESDGHSTVLPPGSSPSSLDLTPGEERVWTCSMHPQIRQNEPGLCPICEMDLIPLENQLSNQDPTVLQMTEESAKLAQINTFTVGGPSEGTSGPEIVVDGTVELDERLTNSQTSHLGGRIERLYVNFTGEYVTAGQKIATIYSPDLLTASKELITANKYDQKISGIREAAIRKLKNWKVTDDQIAAILNSGEEIETIDVYADHSGYVLKKIKSQGDYVQQGGVLFSLGRTNRVWLMFNVFESDLPSIRKGVTVRFSAPAIPGETFQAKISYIDPILNPSNRTAIVRAESPSFGNKLKPGMLLKGTIVSSYPAAKQERLTIPRSAVLWTGKRSVVYVQVPDTEVPSFRYKEVLLGASSGDRYEVLEGLEAREVVVTNGAFVIDAAAQLNNQQSMMNKNVSIKSSGNERHPNYKSNTPDEFRAQLEPVVDVYLEIKDDLVATNADGIRKKSASLLEALDLIDMALLENEGHQYWMEKEPIIRSHTEKLGVSTDIEEQRRQFDFLSQGLIDAVRAFGVAEEALYVHYCPMAFRNKGAGWLSSEDYVRNPYFGDKMLKCGSVLDSITLDMNAMADVFPTAQPPAVHNH